MTQAYNLAILANAVNTSGQLNVGTNATGTLPLANGGTGTTNTVNTVVAGSGISVSTSGTQVTVSTSGAGGVTSLNGETGAITNTNVNAIGSYICAVNAVTANGSDNIYVTANTNDTLAGSALRYNYSTGGNMGAFANSNVRVGGGRGYDQGGTALSGTWRMMGRNMGYNVFGCGGACEWRPGNLVRIS